MKKILVVLLTLLAAVCMTFGVAGAVSADAVVNITDAEDFLAKLAADPDGSFKLTEDIVLPEGKFVDVFYGTLDGDNHSVTVDNNCGIIKMLGKISSSDSSRIEVPGTVKNLTVKGTVKGTGSVGGVAAQAGGTIENVTVEADISSTSHNRLAGVANCYNKNTLLVKDCVFQGTVTYLQGFTSASNYSYFGMFLGYNGGAFGGGTVVNGIARYTLKIPAAEKEKIDHFEYYNINYDADDEADATKKCSYSVSEPDGEGNVIYTFDLIVNMDPVTLASVNDEGIMANYGTPVVRIVLSDGSYRYLDGFDRANGKYRTAFEAASFDKMYKYKDISYLKIVKIADASVSEGSTTVSSTYSQVTVNTAEEFESFARIINSAVPAVFTDEGGKKVQSTILNTLAISVKLGDDIILGTDENGNKSEFYGLGKQEFFPYRGGIDGGNHELHVEIDAPNGYCIGVLGIASEMAEDIVVKDIKVTGHINGNTKVGVIGYFDMVCNEYITGGTARYENVINEANVSGRMGVGGLLGIVSAANDTLKVFFKDCENKGNVTLRDGGMYGGGILGIAGFYGSNKVGVSIDGAVNSGIISGNNCKYLGGIAGYISDGLSSLMDADSTTTPEGNVSARLVGHTGALRTDSASEGDIAEYSITAASYFNNIAFDKEEYGAAYGSAVSSKLVDSSKPATDKDRTAAYSENYNIVATYKKADGTLVEFDGSTEREKNVRGEYSVRLEAGEYTINLILHQKQGYYNVGSVADGTPLGASAKVVVTKAPLAFDFKDLTVPYTGKAVDYLAEAKKAGCKVDLPVASGETAPTASWKVEYYKDGKLLSSAPQDAGEYTVKISLVPTETFKNRYECDYNAVYTKTLKIARVLTVKFKDMEIVKGQNAEYEVTVTSSDGSAFTNIAALGLTFRVKGFGNVQTNALGIGTYTVEVSGKTSLDGYEVTYVSGTLVVKDGVIQDGGDKDKGGCKGCKGSFGGTGLSLAAFALVAALKKRIK